jgi:phospholipid transport system substrate-binding protein
MSGSRLVPFAGSWLRFAAVVALLAGPAVAEESSPRELIQDASDRVLESLREQREAIRSDPDVAFAIARDRILPLLDFERSARWVLGPRWREAGAAQRERFTSVFRDFLVRTYVTAMATYVDEIIAHGDRVTYLPVHFADDDVQTVVRAVIRLQSGMNAEVGYRVHRRDGPWKIYDVTFEGVSMLTTYRVSFASEIERHGLDDLIERLEKRGASAVLPLEGMVSPGPPGGQ